MPDVQGSAISLLNAYVEPTLALIAVDTAGGGGELPKLLPLVHVRGGALLAGRGHMLFLLKVHQLLATSGCADLDALKRDMPALLQRAFPVFLRGLKQLRATIRPFPWRALWWPRKANPADWHQVLVLVGWSEQRQRIVGHMWRQLHWERERGFIESDFTDTGFCCGPSFPGINERRAPRTPAALLELARDQVRLSRADAGPDWPIGGRMILAELTRQRGAARLTIATAGDL